MRFFRSARRIFFSWLAKGLADAQRSLANHDYCTLGKGAMLLPEAEIGNFAGGPDRVEIGDNSFVRGRLQTYGHGGRIKIGRWCYIGVRSEIWSMESIVIGDRVLIAHDVNIHDGTAHSTNAEERHRHFREIIQQGHPTRREDLPNIESAPIVIEDDVWISFGVTILKGVRIGAGSVITAGAMVTRDVPPGVIYKCEISPLVSSLKS